MDPLAITTVTHLPDTATGMAATRLGLPGYLVPTDAAAGVLLVNPLSSLVHSRVPPPGFTASFRFVAPSPPIGASMVSALATI